MSMLLKPSYTTQDSQKVRKEFFIFGFNFSPNQLQVGKENEENGKICKVNIIVRIELLSMLIIDGPEVLLLLYIW